MTQAASDPVLCLVHTALALWQAHLSVLSQIDPALAMDLQGDPPVWISDLIRRQSEAAWRG